MILQSLTEVVDTIRQEKCNFNKVRQELVEGCRKIAENGICFRQILRDYSLILAVTPLFHNFRHRERSKMSEIVNYRLTPYKGVGIRWLGEKFVEYNRI